MANIYGTSFNDVIDALPLGNSNDYIFAGNGNDLVYGWSGNDTIDGWNGNDTLLGEAGNDLLLGFNGNDVLLGGSGNDVLLGEAGNDFLNGQGGFDTLTGGTGADIFSVSEFDYAGSGYAVINDFNYAQGDKVQLDFSFDQYTYVSGNLAGSASADTLIYNNNDLIAVVADATGVDFIPALDVISVV